MPWIYRMLYWWKPFQYFWSHLPDKCEGYTCPRTGVRGNENRVRGRILCDYCTMHDIIPTLE